MNLLAALVALVALQDDTDYYPLAVGHRWVYHVTAEGDERLHEDYVESFVYRSDKIEKIPVYQLACVSSSERLNVRQTVSIGADGLRVHDDQSGAYSPALLALKLPLTPGDTWESKSSIDAFTVVAKGRIAADETIGVHAGVFTARKVTVRFEVRATKEKAVDTLETRAWYARKVGLVRYEIETKRGLITLRLASFHPADPNAATAAKEWFPTSNNLVWHYDATGFGEKNKLSLEMRRTKSETIPTYSIRELGDQNPPILEVSSDATGLRLHAFESQKLRPPHLVAAFPLKVGSRVESTEVERYRSEMISLVEAEEEVTVKAGTFSTLRIVIATKTRMREAVTVTLWLAKNVGIVKARISAYGDITTLELRSFEK